MATVSMQDAREPTTRLRPVEAADLALLGELDAAYAVRTRTAKYVNRASLHYFARSGHSFVAEDPTGATLGFVLAHTVWSGGEATLRLERLVTAGGPDLGALPMLVEAVVKSAYDAGVYELRAESPKADQTLRAALEADRFEGEAVVTYRRRLGSGSPLGVAR